MVDAGNRVSYTSDTETDNGANEMDAGWRVATAGEIRQMQAEPGAPHVKFGCTCCGMVNWTAKNLALGSDGSYTGARGIFVSDWNRGECVCPGNYLRAVMWDAELAAA